MRRYAIAALCFAGLIASSARGQKITLEPVHAAAGAVLTFHVQALLHSDNGNETHVLPRGTVIRVKLLDSINSTVDHDGAPFHGAVVAPVLLGNEVVVHAESQALGLLALLRSRSHPDGFRYELLITSVTDHGKSYVLTASLDPSFSDDNTQSISVPQTEKIESPRESTPSARN